MKNLNSFQRALLFFTIFIAATQVKAGAVVSYHGRILKPDGTPLEGAAVAFKIQVRSPGATNCLLYEETRTVNMLGSNGMFVIPIGDGVGIRTGADPAITIENVFSNNSALNFTGLTCNSGSSFSPASLDARKLLISFNDGSGAGSQDLVPMDINYVPLALHTLEAQSALKVGSTPAANVMTVSGPASALTPSNFTELLALVNGTSTTYAKTSSSVGGDLSGTIASANVVKLQGRAVSSSAPSTSDVLTWNGSAWAPAAGGGGGGAVSSVAGRTGAVVLANTDISGLGNASTKNVGTTAGTVAAGDDARFGTASVFTGSFTGDVTGTQSTTVVSAVGGSTAANVHNAELLANSATSANTVSTIVRRDANGDFISRDASLRSVILRDSGSKNITMVAPATLTNNYTLTWPTDKGTLNQVLTTDASGNLSWSTPAGSGVSTVTSGGAPIVIGGSGSAPTVSVNAATDSTSGVVTLATDGGTTASTVVQATDARLSNARTPSGNAGGDLSSTYPNPTVSGIKGAAITYTSLTTGDFLKYNGSAWVNTALSSANLSNDSNLLKASQMPANCSASQALTFSSPTGTWVCSNIAGLDAGVITTGTIADNRLPASATYWQAATGGINYAGGNVGVGTTTPNSTLQVAGSVATGFAAKSSAYTLTSTDSIVTANATSAAFSLTLPSAVGIAGRQYTLKKIDSSANAVTVATTSSQTIDGAATFSLPTQYKYVTVISDGANWGIIGTNSVAGGGGSGATQTFDSNGTWTKPASGALALIECWGAGGGGGRSVTGNYSIDSSGGGGGGAFVSRTVPFASLGATETVTVGAGGSGGSATAKGGDGGDSSFGAWVKAYGGNGGAINCYQTCTASSAGSGGGGLVARGSGSSGGPPSFAVSGDGDGTGTVSFQGDSGYTGYSLYHGGGGSSSSYVGGGSSVYGGAGGGGTSPSGASGGGTSTFAGNGGAASNGGTAGAGGMPGGGGGAARNGTAGAGGGGRCRITVY